MRCSYRTRSPMMALQSATGFREERKPYGPGISANRIAPSDCRIFPRRWIHGFGQGAASAARGRVVTVTDAQPAAVYKKE
jgi:hypothetical protein